MGYDSENDRRQMFPAGDRRRWSPTDWYREAVDVFEEYIESGDRIMGSGTALHTRDYFKLTSAAKEIVKVRDHRNEENQQRPHYLPADEATDFGA